MSLPWENHPIFKRGLESPENLDELLKTFHESSQQLKVLTGAALGWENLFQRTGDPHALDCAIEANEKALTNMPEEPQDF